MAVRRVEDPELLRGEGTFVDNVEIDGAAHLTFVRSPLPHALIRDIDVAARRGAPGLRYRTDG